MICLQCNLLYLHHLCAMHNYPKWWAESLHILIGNAHKCLLLRIHLCHKHNISYIYAYLPTTLKYTFIWLVGFNIMPFLMLIKTYTLHEQYKYCEQFIWTASYLFAQLFDCALLFPIFGFSSSNVKLMYVMNIFKYIKIYITWCKMFLCTTTFVLVNLHIIS